MNSGEIRLSVEDLEGEIEDLRAEISDHREEIRRLKAEMNVLRRWRDRAVQARTEDQQEEIPQFEADFEGPIPQDEWPAGDKPSPSEAVDRLVAECPGIKKDDFAEVAIERGLDSEARDPRNVLLTALRRRVNDEKVWEDPRKRLWPWDHRKAVRLRQALDEAEMGELTMALRDASDQVEGPNT